MPQFQDHVKRAKHNLKFLEHINTSGGAYADWQVTTCYYAGVHLINAHLAQHNMQFRKHVDVKDAINPKSQRSVSNGSALQEDVYLAYAKLQNLSRRSRYLVNDRNPDSLSSVAYNTEMTHLANALRYLDILICFFNQKYQINIVPIKVSCGGIKTGDLFLIA